MMTAIRYVLGKIILTLNGVFAPKRRERPIGEVMKIEQETKDWRLYQLVACPFCVKVRRELTRLGVDLKLFDIKDPTFHSELMAGGKIDQVPCLMIPSSTGGEVKWIYESDEIISFLQTRFR